MVAMTPMFMSTLMTSVALTAIFCAHHRCGRHLEAVLAIARTRHRARPGAALFLVARADVGRDVQLLTPITGVLVIRGRGGRCCNRRPLARHDRRCAGRALTIALARAALVFLTLGATAHLIIAAALLGDA